MSEPTSEPERLGAILFADICGSTSLFEDTGDWAAFEVIGGVLGLHGKIAEDTGGAIIRSKGDDLLCTFDDAEDALDALDAARQMLLANREAAALIRIGLHYGTYIGARGDIFGDAVNVTARLVDLATPAEGLASEDFTKQLSAEWRDELMPFDEQTLRGKDDPLQLFRLVPPGDNTTGMFYDQEGPSTVARRMRVTATVRFDNSEFVLTDKTSPLKTGRALDADIYISSRRVSRVHATIDVNNGRAVLHDRSSHGTWVVTGASELQVRRETIHLMDEDTVWLGGPPSAPEAYALHYTVVQETT
jgi:adenylate cyclase